MKQLNVENICTKLTKNYIKRGLDWPAPLCVTDKKKQNISNTFNKFEHISNSSLPFGTKNGESKSK